LGAGRANLVAYLAPPFALGYGALLHGEHVGPAAVVGLVLILGGVWLASSGRQDPGVARELGERVQP
jgi:drug/metabolite transporter (DMT)-like permease